MNPLPWFPLNRCCFALWLALLGGAAPALAAGISCSSTSMTALNFGTINPLAGTPTQVNATLTYSCTNSDTKAHAALVCFHIGEPGGRSWNPRLMLNGANTLQFQLYQDSGLGTIWGSYGFGSPTPLAVPIKLAAKASTSGTATLYGQVPGGQSLAIPGAYTDVYQSGDTAVSIADVVGTTVPSTCSSSWAGVVFPFTVSTTVAKQCLVTAASDVNLGSQLASATNVDANGNISVTCSNTTPYTVGLRPSNGSTTGAGVMSAPAGNTDQVPYQLYRDAARTAAWGTAATASNTGSGAAQPFTVYVRVPSADYRPGSYSDTVTVVVNY